MSKSKSAERGTGFRLSSIGHKFEPTNMVVKRLISNYNYHPNPADFCFMFDCLQAVRVIVLLRWPMSGW